MGIILTLGAVGVYVWGALKWNDSRVDPTDKTMFRSWRVNFLSFWVSAGVTLINLAFASAFRYPISGISTKSSPLNSSPTSTTGNTATTSVSTTATTSASTTATTSASYTASATTTSTGL